MSINTFSKTGSLGLALTGLLLLVIACLPNPARADETSLTPDQLLENITSGRFTGETIDLKFEGAHLKNILLFFPKLTDFPITCDPEIQSLSWTINESAQWDAALAKLLKSLNLSLKKKNEGVRVYREQMM